MASIEALIKVGALSGGWQDGDVIAVAPPGAYFTPAECAAWFDSGTLPSGLAGLARYRRQQIARRFRELREVIAASDADIAAWYGVSIADAEEIRSRAASDVTKCRTLGFDTAWGWGDLSSHLGVVLANVPLEYLFELLEPPLNGTLWREKPTLRRAWRATDWRSGLPAAFVARVEDPTEYVAIRRNQPQDAATFLTYAG